MITFDSDELSIDEIRDALSGLGSQHPALIAIYSMIQNGLNEVCVSLMDVSLDKSDMKIRVGQLIALNDLLVEIRRYASGQSRQEIAE